MITIKSPRPPLNLFEVARVNIDSNWTTVYDVPRYEIPADGPTPLTYANTAAIATSLLVANTSPIAVSVSVRIVDSSNSPFSLLTDLLVPINDYAMIDLERHVIKTAEKLQLKCGTAQTASVHFAFVLNQREQFEVIP